MRQGGRTIDLTRRAELRRGVLAAVAGGAAVLLFGSTAAAETISVTTKDDSGPGSLREAIEEANDELSTPGPDTIKINVAGTISLASALPDLMTAMTIAGPGAKSLTVARAPAAPNFRVFTLTEPVAVSIKQLAIKNGVLNAPSSFGGGIFNSGTMSLNSVLISSNSVADPTGFAQGAGVYNNGTLTIRNSRISRNEVEADGAGGGIRSEGNLTLERSTVDRNTNSAAVYTGSGSSSATIQNSTIADNEGIGLFGSVAESLVVTSSTIAHNDGTSFFRTNVQITGSSANAQFGNTIVAEPPAKGTNCVVSELDSNGFNLQSDTSCPFDEITDRANKNPKLGPLEMNGGATPTMAIPKSSPATDKGGSGGLTTDQRRKRRPVNFPDINNAPGGDGSDSGAFEIQKP